MDNLPTKLEFPVIEEGQEIVRPDVINAVTQLAQLAQLVRMRKLEESKVPIGAPTFEWTVTDTIKEITLHYPWIGFYLINDGTGNIRLRINTLEGDISQETTIDSGETITRDFKYPIVSKIFLVTEVAGTTATVRVFAEEGRRWR